MFSQNSNDKELPCEMYVNNQSKDKHNKYKKRKKKNLKKTVQDSKRPGH